MGYDFDIETPQSHGLKALWFDDAASPTPGTGGFPKSARAGMLSSASAKSPETEVGLYDFGAKGLYDPANTPRSKHKDTLERAPRGGYGSYGIIPVTANGQDMWQAVRQKLPNTFGHQAWANDDDFEDFKYVGVEFGTQVPYGVRGAYLASTGHQEEDKVVILSGGPVVSDYGSSHSDRFSSFMFDIEAADFLSDTNKARWSTSHRVRPYLGIKKTSSSNPTQTKPAPTLPPGFPPTQNPTPPAEGEDIPPAGSPITGPDIEKFTRGIAWQLGDDHSNFTTKRIAGDPYPAIPGTLGFATFGDQRFPGSPRGNINGFGFNGSHYFHEVEANFSALVSGPFIYASSKHELAGFPKDAPPEGLRFDGFNLVDVQERTLRAGALHTNAYFWDGNENSASAALPHPLVASKVNPNYDGPYAFDRYTRPPVGQGPFLMDVDTPFDFYLDHHWLRGDPYGGGRQRYGGKWHPMAFTWWGQYPPPVPPPYAEPSPPEKIESPGKEGEDIGDGGDGPGIPGGVGRGWTDEGHEQRITHPGKMISEGNYGQARPNLLHGRRRTERQVQPLTIAAEDSWATRSGDFSQGFGDSLLDRFAMPLTHGEHVLPVFPSAEIAALNRDAAPGYTVEPDISFERWLDNKLVVNALKSGTGSAFKVFAPAELLDYQLYGSDGAGVIPVEEYPSAISDLTVLLWNSAGEGATRLAFGLPSLDSTSPRNGFVFEQVEASTLQIFATDGDGADADGLLSLEGNLGVAGHVDLAEIGAPGTPASGTSRLYVKSDGKAYLKDDAGTEYDLTASGGGGGDPFGTLEQTVNLASSDVELSADEVGDRTRVVADAEDQRNIVGIEDTARPIFMISSVGATELILTNMHGDLTAGIWPIVTGLGGDYTIAPDSAPVVLMRDDVSEVWRIL